MNPTAFEKLVAVASRRELTETERLELESMLRRYPELRPVWEQEEQLNRILRRLPAAPVSTNFTSQVLDQIHSYARRRQSSWIAVLANTVFRPRLAWRFAAVLVVLALFIGVYKRHDTSQNTLETCLAALPAESLAQVELWTDFDVIRHLPSQPLPSVFELAEALR